MDICRWRASYMFSQNLTSEHLEDFASMANIEFVLIDKNTNLYQLKNELRWNEAAIQDNINK